MIRYVFSGLNIFYFLNKKRTYAFLLNSIVMYNLKIKIKINLIVQVIFDNKHCVVLQMFNYKHIIINK